MVFPAWTLRLIRSPKKVQRAKDIVNDFLEECIAIRLAEDSLQNTNRTTDLLEILLTAESNGLIGRDDVKGQLLTFVFAGHDTTSHTLSYMLWEVCSYFACIADLFRVLNSFT
jgi:cytochrome P450